MTVRVRRRRRAIADRDVDAIVIASQDSVHAEQVVAALRRAIDDGTIGPPVLVHNVGRGVSSAPNATSEFAVTGSAIHEFDIVPLALASWVLGEPERIAAVGQDVPGREVHGQVSAVLRHRGGAQSAINTTIMRTPRTAPCSPGRAPHSSPTGRSSSPAT